MTTKGNKSTVATTARELREVRALVVKHTRKLEAAETRLAEVDRQLATLVDLVNESLDSRFHMVLADAYSDRRHVAGLEDRVGVLEAPFWKRRDERRLATERRIERLRESARIARETVGRIPAPDDDQVDQVLADALERSSEQVGRVVELAGVAKVAKLKKSIEDGDVELRSPDDVPDPN